MAIVRILRDGKHVKPLGSQVAISLRAWWQGVATERDQAIVTPLLADLHATSQWLTCDCITGSDLPILAPAQLGRLFFLRRLTQRKSHAENCVFWSAQTQPAAPDLSGGGVAAMGSMPSFLIEGDDNSHVSNRAVNPVRDGDQKSRKPGLPAMAKRLFWLAEKSGWQHAPIGHSLKDLLKTAESIQITPNINLKHMLYCTPKVWTHQWADTAFKRCAQDNIAQACWWIQCAISIDMESRTIKYLSDEGSQFTVRVAGELKVFGGDCSIARFPMLVIGALCKQKNGEVIFSKAYAQPVVSEQHWMLMDSNRERQTLADLLSVCRWLHETKGLTVEIDKPLFDWHQTGERPDFVLTARLDGVPRHMVVETMGYEDQGYEARKAELAKNIGCEVYFDRRHQADNHGKELKSAVAKWALRG